MAITIETRGRRHYLIGDTFPIKGAIKSAGCKWDPDAKAWYSGKRETVEGLVTQLASGAVKPTASYSKLADGSWGVRIPGTVAVGDSVTVVTRAGDSKTETIAAVLSTVDGMTVCSVVPRQRKQGGARRRSYGGRGSDIRGWDGVIGSPSYYSSGAFDEYDM